MGCTSYLGLPARPRTLSLDRATNLQPCNSVLARLTEPPAAAGAQSGGERRGALCITQCVWMVNKFAEQFKADEGEAGFQCGLDAATCVQMRRRRLPGRISASRSSEATMARSCCRRVDAKRSVRGGLAFIVDGTRRACSFLLPLIRARHQAHQSLRRGARRQHRRGSVSRHRKAGPTVLADPPAPSPTTLISPVPHPPQPVTCIFRFVVCTLRPRERFVWTDTTHKMLLLTGSSALSAFTPGIAPPARGARTGTTRMQTIKDPTGDFGERPMKNINKVGVSDERQQKIYELMSKLRARGQVGDSSEMTGAEAFLSKPKPAADPKAEEIKVTMPDLEEVDTRTRECGDRGDG